jgi:hypothetical protein
MGPQGPQGPGAAKVDFFEAPTPADPIHHAIAVGPLQIGINCNGSPTGTGEIRLGTYLTIPGPQTTLSVMNSAPTESPGYETITGSVKDLGSEFAYTKSNTFSGTFIVAGPDGVPYWLWLAYGDTIEAKSETFEGLTEATPRGCWLLAEEI